MNSAIKKDYLWNTIGVLLQNAISPLLLVVVTRFNGLEESGVFSFAFSVAIIFWIAGMWGGRTYQVSDVKREFSSSDYVFTRLILAIALLAASILFCVVNHYSAQQTSLIIALVLFKCIESVSDAVYGVIQSHKALHLTGKSLLYKAVVGFVLFAMIDYLTGNLIFASLSLGIINLVVFLGYDVRIARKLELEAFTIASIPHTLRTVRNVLQRSALFFGVSFLAAFSLNIPRYFLEMYHKEQIGYFGIIAMPITLVVLVITFILQPNILALSKQYAAKDFDAFHKNVMKLLSITLGVGVVILVGTWLFGVQLLGIVFGIDFAHVKLELLIMVFGAIASAQTAIIINILTIMRRFKAQLFALLVTNALLLVLAPHIIEQYAMLGGVVLFTMTNSAQIVVLLVIYNRASNHETGNEKN